MNNLTELQTQFEKYRQEMDAMFKEFNEVMQEIKSKKLIERAVAYVAE